MAAGTDAIIEYTLTSGESVFLNVNHIVSITGNQKRKKFHTGAIGTTLITVSSGEVFETTDRSVADAVTDTRATIAESPKISGGRF